MEEPHTQETEGQSAVSAQTEPDNTTQEQAGAQQNEQPKAAVKPVAQSSRKEATAFGYKVSDLRSLLLKFLLGCLVAAAGVAVLAILAGGMGDIVWRAIGTISAAAIHIVILFAVLNSISGTPRRSSNLIVNAAFGITVMSFFTAVFNVWDVIQGDTVGKLYATYFILLISLLHIKVLMDVSDAYLPARNYARANYGAIWFVVVLLLGVLYLPDGGRLLDGFYGRLLAASVVIDVTLTIVVAVMHRIFLQKHPELAQNNEDKHSSGRLIVLIILFMLVLWPVIAFVASLSGMH